MRCGKRRHTLGSCYSKLVNTLSRIELLVIVGPLLLIVAYSFVIRLQQNRRIEPDASSPIQTEPPEKLSPAELGYIHDYQIGTDELFGTTCDLVFRGYLRIEIVGGSSAEDSTDIKLQRGEHAADDQLELHEQILLAAFLSDTDQPQISLLENPSRYQAALGSFPQAVQKVLERKGYFRPDRSLLKLFLISFGLTPIFALTYFPLVFPIFLGPICYIFIVGSRRSATQKVTQLWPVLSGYHNYILKTAVDRAKFFAAPVGVVDIAEREFAYVVAFGKNRAWEQATSKVIENIEANNRGTASQFAFVMGEAGKTVSLQRRLMQLIKAYPNHRA